MQRQRDLLIRSKIKIPLIKLTNFLFKLIVLSICEDVRL